MYAFAVLSLAASSLALPILENVGLGAVADAAGKIVAPVTAAVQDVDVSKIGVANGAGSGNVVGRSDITAPVDGVVSAVGGILAPVTGVVSDVGLSDLGIANGAGSGNVVGRSDITAPVDGVVSAVGGVLAPVSAVLKGVDVSNIGIANGALANNVVGRDGLTLPPLPTIIASAQANMTQVVSTIQGLLGQTPAASALVGPLGQVTGILSEATSQLGLLNGLGLGDILGQGSSQISTEEAAKVIAQLTNTASGIVSNVTAQLGNDVPELKPVISTLNSTISTLYTTVTGLVSGISSTLLPLLTPVMGILNNLGLGAGLSLGNL